MNNIYPRIKMTSHEQHIVETIEKFKKSGITILDQLTEKAIYDMIKFANKQYFNNISIMTDIQYDIMKQHFEKKYPNNTIISEIGAEVERNKVSLPYEMASMDKIKPDTNALENWTHKFKGPYLVSCKVDGISALYTTIGKTSKLYTRGNGKIGQDISHFIPFLNLPKVKNIAIRGELIISKKVFEDKYKSLFANARNMVAGIVSHKHINDAIKDVDFVAYEVINPEISPSIQMDFLENIKINRIMYKISDTLSNDFLSNILVDWRKNYKYEIDGVIVVDDNIYTRKPGNPEYAFAFKMVLSDQIAEACVVDVIWTPSKDGYLKPRVQIEPIKLGGVTIEFATGFNAAFITENNIGIGTIIQLIRSGDVIPYIQSVVVPSNEPKMPSLPYIWNETKVDIMIENANEDPIVIEKNITGFFRGIGVERLSNGNITRLINAGYTSVSQIIAMSEEDFLNIGGFKDKMANKIYHGIKEKLNDASLIMLMAASNIFGRGFSEKKIELIINEVPLILTSDDTIEQKIQTVTQIKGMANKSAEAFVNKISEFKDFLIKCGLEYKLNNNLIEVSQQSHILSGKTIVLTGTRDKSILEFIKKINAINGSNISKNTFLVIAKNIYDDTSKLKEAKSLNIPLITIDDFIKTYM